MADPDTTAPTPRETKAADTEAGTATGATTGTATGTGTADTASEPAITYARVFAIALPVVLSNATVPLQGAIDTAIIGNLGDATLLAAIALGASAMAMLLGTFSFLQIGVSGTVARALGAGRPESVTNTLLRALILAFGIASLLILFQGPLIAGVLMLFEASAEAEAAGARYMSLRIWGAPIELANYAFMGWFAGQERTRRLFEMQLTISLTNVTATSILVLGLGLDMEGVAIGTIIGHAAGLAWATRSALARSRAILPQGWRPKRAQLLDPAELGTLLRLNRDLFIRTVLLLISFAWITRMGSLQGDTILAVNGILFEFFLVTTAGLDGFAIAAEALVGRAIGQRSVPQLRRAILISSVAAVVLACIFALLLSIFAMDIVRLFTTSEAVRTAAEPYLLWAALVPLAGVVAFQLDGIFVGAAAGVAMRNAMIVVAVIFLPMGQIITQAFGNHGTWAAIWLFLLLRSLLLAVQYPALEARTTRAMASPAG
ncbi:MAG: MATE family efflux transporter [Pseudomonadota bacterium]